MKPLILLAFLSGVGLLSGQPAHDDAPEPKFSELSHDAHAETSLPRQRARSSSYVPCESQWLILCPIQPTAAKACSLQTTHQIGNFAGGVPDDPRFVIGDHA
jgi:hypothetical protein